MPFLNLAQAQSVEVNFKRNVLHLARSCTIWPSASGSRSQSRRDRRRPTTLSVSSLNFELRLDQVLSDVVQIDPKSPNYSNVSLQWVIIFECVEFGDDSAPISDVPGDDDGPTSLTDRVGLDKLANPHPKSEKSAKTLRANIRIAIAESFRPETSQKASPGAKELHSPCRLPRQRRPAGSCHTKRDAFSFHSALSTCIPVTNCSITFVRHVRAKSWFASPK